MKNAWQLEPIFWAPTPKLGGGWIAHKDSPSPPPAPDYAGAAKQTAQSQMTSQYTPFGSQVYSPDQNSPSGFQSNITLNPQAQDTLNTQLGVSNQLGHLSSDQAGAVAGRAPFSLGSVPQIADKAYSAMTSRLDPQWKAAEESNDAQLANQGITRGSEAYDNAKRQFGQQKNDAYQQANLGAISTMPQTFQLVQAAHEQPLNELNALRTGAQIQNPQFSQQPGANLLGATQAQGQYGQGLYNAQVGSQNALTSGLFGLGGAGMLALSDRRLKSNVERIGTHPLGIGIYEYDIAGHRIKGVMADEVLSVRPEAVVRLPSGYMMVDYGML